MADAAIAAPALSRADSFAARFGLAILTWGLPFHVATMAVLFGLVGLAAGQVRMIAAWKEAFAALLVATVVLRAATGRGTRSGITWTDVWVGGMMGLALVFLIAGQPLFRFRTPVGAALFGFRDLAFFLILYVVGRATPSVVSDPRTLRRLFAVAFVTALIAVIEWFFITPEQLALLGIASYFQDFLGLSVFTEGAPHGLPASYWTPIGGRHVQRAGSVFVSGQGMAVPFLLLIPASTAALIMRGRPRLPAVAAYGVVWLGFLLTITRMSIIAAVIGLVLFTLLLRRPEWAASTATTLVLALLVGLAAIPGLAGFAWDTLTWQTSSSVTHARDWSSGVTAFLSQPLGHGLGTADLAATRAGLQPLTADNLYLKYAVELGILGISFLLLILGGIALSAARVLRETTHRVTRLSAIVVLVTTAGILVNAMTAALFNSFPLTYLYFWLAGGVVTVSQRLAPTTPAAVRTTTDSNG